MINRDANFELGALTVTIFTTDGIGNIEDWNQVDADEAEKYASEVAFYTDVLFVVFEDNKKGIKKTFTGQSAGSTHSTQETQILHRLTDDY